ncbi:MAG: alpha/beta hydrolase [Pirellulales bacterium]
MKSLSMPRPAPPASDTNVSTAVYSPGHPHAPQALFGPLHYEPNYAYPLLVWLHGPGDDETQLRRVMPMISLRNYVAVAPRGTGASAGRSGHGWPQNQAEIGLAEQRVFDGIDAARRKFHVHERRIFLAGFDCGGTMAFRLALMHPEMFAGVISLGGAFPSRHSPLARLNRARNLPILLSTGRDSGVYPPEKVCEDLRLFHTAGFQVALRQYPCGQEIALNMLSDIDRWMMEQINCPATSICE